MPKLKVDDNPVINRQRRYHILGKRLKKLQHLARPATVEYDKDGYAARLYPHYGKKHQKAKKLASRIRKERRQIRNWLIKHGYKLA